MRLFYVFYSNKQRNENNHMKKESFQNKHDVEEQFVHKLHLEKIDIDKRSYKHFFFKCILLKVYS